MGAVTREMAAHNNLVRAATKKMVERKGDSPSISPEEVLEAFKEIMAGDATEGQVAAFLLALQCCVQLDAHILNACASAMVDVALPCQVDRDAVRPMVDIVGTGGDGMDTFNVSTASGFVVAASGCVVVKHGNRSSSGSVGSADFLEALGVNINMNNERTAVVVNTCGFGFLFAQQFHPAMKHVAAVRKQIGVRTVFNLLGPLSNPANPDFQVTGVADASLGPIFAEVFRMQGRKRAMVIHSREGMNEVSPSGQTDAWVLQDGEISHRVLTPEADFGVVPVPLDQWEAELIVGGSSEQRAEAFRAVLSGQTNGLRKFIVINCAVALWVAGKADDFKAAAALAEETITSGKAKVLLEEYSTLTNAA